MGGPEACTVPDRAFGCGRVAVGTECMTMSQDVRCMYNTDILADLGSYNSLRNQVAFCKMQVS